MPGYKKNYIKIYFWQLLSFVLNFVALFVVTPMLSSMQEIFGIYSVCVGLNVFLNYADFGFLVAGKKFAAATIEGDDIITEKKFVGTSMSIYSAFSLLLLFGLSIFVISPDMLITGVSNNQKHLIIARKLLLILAFSIIVTLLQKFVEFIYSLRLEEYKVQRALICSNIIKIASVPIYFFNSRYDIVGYYAFSQIVTLLSCLYVIFRSKEIGYGVKSIYAVFKFDRPSFDLMKGLAFGGFGSTLAWILFYEVDTIAISAMLGAKAVAIYAVGRSIQTFVRSINGIVYGPYNVRFYYFAGNGDVDGMRRFFYVLTSFLSILIIPIVAISVFAEPFTIAWVGYDYFDSVVIMQVLVFCFVFNCITNPCGSTVYAFNKPKELLVGAILQPVVFWLGVLFTVSIWGVESFAYFKVLGCTVSAIYCFFIAKKILHFDAMRIVVANFLLPLLIAFILCNAVWGLSHNYLDVTGKSSSQLFNCIGWMGGACFTTFIGYFLFIKSFRITLLNIVKR